MHCINCLYLTVVLVLVLDTVLYVQTQSKVLLTVNESESLWTKSYSFTSIFESQLIWRWHDFLMWLHIMHLFQLRFLSPWPLSFFLVILMYIKDMSEERELGNPRKKEPECLQARPNCSDDIHSSSNNANHSRNTRSVLDVSVLLLCVTYSPSHLLHTPLSCENTF